VAVALAARNAAVIARLQPAEAQEDTQLRL